MNTLAKIMILASLVAFLSTVPTSAEEGELMLGGSYGVGFSFPMGDLANNRLYDAKFGRILSFDAIFYLCDSFGFGFSVSIDRFNVGNASELYPEGIANLDIIDWDVLSFTYFFNTKRRFQPYLESNLGGSQMRLKVGDDKLKSGVSFAGGTSAGALYFVQSERIGLFGEVSYRYSEAKYGDVGSKGYSIPRVRVKLGIVVLSTLP